MVAIVLECELAREAVLGLCRHLRRVHVDRIVGLPGTPFEFLTTSLGPWGSTPEHNTTRCRRLEWPMSTAVLQRPKGVIKAAIWNIVCITFSITSASSTSNPRAMSADRTCSTRAPVRWMHVVSRHPKWDIGAGAEDTSVAVAPLHTTSRLNAT